jgi:tripartite-type tricarboxylate transporter receptor subunit TctC
MNTNLKTLLSKALISLLGFGFLGHSFAADQYPSKPVTLVIPYGPGGGTDILGRILGKKLSEIWNQPVVIVNKPGASGLVGAKFGMAANPDGYTLIVGSTGTLMSIAKSSGANATEVFKSEESVTSITMIAAPPYIVAANPKLGVISIAELLKYAKSKPDELTFGSSGVGSASHLTGELFKEMAGVKIRHIPYKGTGPAVVDLLSGQISLMFGPAPTLGKHLESGSLVGLAVTPMKRSSVFPKLPTVNESGVSGFESAGWFGLFAPKGVPADILKAIHTTALKALSSDDVKTQLADQGAEPEPMQMEEFKAFVNKDIVKWSKLRAQVTQANK